MVFVFVLLCDRLCDFVLLCVIASVRVYFCALVIVRLCACLIVCLCGCVVVVY